MDKESLHETLGSVIFKYYSKIVLLTCKVIFRCTTKHLLLTKPGFCLYWLRVAKISDSHLGILFSYHTVIKHNNARQPFTFSIKVGLLRIIWARLHTNQEYCFYSNI